jgi:GNAT superfamily N-acetyltransferase
MTPKIRRFTPSDYGAYAAIHNAIDPLHPLIVKASMHEDWWFGRTRFKLRRYVVEVEGNVVAVGSFFHELFAYHPKAFSLRLEVHPKSQRQGIGSLLYEKLLSELRELGARRVWTPAFPRSRPARFLERRGFVITRREIESLLILRRFDPARLGPATARVKARGIDIRDLASELRDDLDAGRKLFELENGAGEDVPRILKSGPITYEEYSMGVLQSPAYIQSGSFVAKTDEEYVGASSLWEAGRDGYLAQGFTAVRKGYRRRGIATALKLSVAKSAADMGAKYLRTSNDVMNRPMIALNRKLGFGFFKSWAIYEKKLPRPD